MIELGPVEPAAPFDGKRAGTLLFLVCRGRRLEVTRIGEAIGADWPAIGQGELGAVILAEITARRPVLELDLELHSARDNADFAGAERDAAELGKEEEASVLRHDQKLTVRIVEVV